MKKIILLIIPFFLLQCGDKTGSSGKTGLSSEMYVVAKKGLFLRAEPSQNGKTIALIPFRSRVNITEASDKTVQINGVTAPWYKIKWNSQEGWAFGGFLKPLFAYSNKILMYPILNINSYVPDNIFKYGNKTRLNFEDLKAVPDILIDSAVVVIDKNEVYNDSVDDIYTDPDSEDNYVFFTLRSGKKHNVYSTAVYFRKSYYDSLSKTPPVPVKMQGIKDRDLSEKIYKAIAKHESAWLIHSTSPNKDKESIARKDFDLAIYDLSADGNKSYLATLKNKDKKTWYYNTFIFMTNGKILFTGNGSFLNAFTVNNVLYMLIDTWLPESEGSNKEIFINKNGVIEKYTEDGAR